MPPHQQPCYQPVKYFKQWSVLVSIKNWNIVQFSHKARYSKELDKIHKVVLDGIRDNMYSLVKLVNMVLLIQQLQPQRATMSSKFCQKPTKYKRKETTSCKSSVHELYSRKHKVILGTNTTIK